jgi:uncharacterized protein
MVAKKIAQKSGKQAPSQGLFANTGNGPTLQPIDIGHPDWFALVDPDTAFWSLVKRENLAETLTKGPLLTAYRKKAGQFAEEMNILRFGLKPSAVYFNPTERCNLNCMYCYIPEKMRKNGAHMPQNRLFKALEILKSYFKTTVPKGRRPQIIFHGAEPLLNRDAVFAGIDKFGKDFNFGIQTNATLLDDSAVEFIKSRGVSIGISLDGPVANVADRARKNWAGQGVYKQVIEAMHRLEGYDAWSVICTVTNQNLGHLSQLVDFFHEHKVPTCLLNVLRCTLPPSRKLKPDDAVAARHFTKALDRSYELYQKTGQKLVVANFANIILSIVAPTARRLMCDISPCGGGRCFFALAPNGDIFPCSEFIGLESFNGGNLFKDAIPKILKSEPFELVTGRSVDKIEPCRRCAIRNFCGSPCPGEAHEMNGGMDKTGAFCEFYEEQVRYAFRLIADKKEQAFLWDGWDKATKTTF